MSGICGWHDSRAARKPVAPTIRRMAGRLPRGANFVDLQSPRGSLASNVGYPGVVHDSDAGLAAVVEGSPRWNDVRLDKIAADMGVAQALLQAYKEYGSAFLQHLAGSFALAILNERANELLLAIDRMGIRPLCYAVRDEGRLVFGSNTDAVLAHGNISSEPSPQSIYDYIYFHIVPSPATIYTDIDKLEPGQFLISRNGSIVKEFYWQPEFSTHSAVNREELRTELRACMRKVVARCVLDNTTGGFLSGGLDSSTVCGLANENVDGPMRAYSIGFAQQGYDEIEYARVAADHFGLDLNEYYVTPDDVADTMELIATAYDEPFGNSSALPALFCARRANADGVHRLLAGDGGDELFAGNERYARQQVFQRYAKVPKWLRSRIIEPLLFGLPTDWNRVTRKARRYIEQARLPMPERLQTYNFLHMQSVDSIFDEDFVKQVDVGAPIAALDRWYGRSNDADLIDKMLFLDWKITLADNDLRKVNRMCELAGVEVAYPMLDSELVEMSACIPACYKINRGQLRRFFKDAMSDYLPHRILVKQKHGFGLPFGDWLRSSKRLQETVMPRLEDIRHRGIFRDDFINGLIKCHQEVHAAHYGNIIWVLTALETWLQYREKQTVPKQGG